MTSALEQACADMGQRMAEIQRRQQEQAAKVYDRERAAILVAANPERLDEPGYLLERLENAVRAEERRAASGWHGYDSNRHLGLLEALEGERAAMREREGV